MAPKRGKAKKNPPPPLEPVVEPGPGSSRPLRIAARIALALTLGVVLVVMIFLLGREAGWRVSSQDRYTVRFAEIRCDSPPGTDPRTFLTEVRYLANFPETIQSVDPALNAKLSAAFAQHPWVDSVAGVRVEPNGMVHVDLRFRSPVLRVTIVGENDTRAVDKNGVLLPTEVGNIELPVLLTPVLAPTVPAGSPWPDPVVKRAAELAESYHPQQIEKTDKGWRLTPKDGKPLLVGW